MPLLFAVEVAAAASVTPSIRSIENHASADPFARMRQSIAWEIALVPHTGPEKFEAFKKWTGESPGRYRARFQE
jgi:hypothetical protein